MFTYKVVCSVQKLLFNKIISIWCLAFGKQCLVFSKHVVVLQVLLFHHVHMILKHLKIFNENILIEEQKAPVQERDRKGGILSGCPLKTYF